MTIALVGAFATIAALIGAAAWVVSIVRADGRDRAAAMQLAEKLQGDVNVERERATASIAALSKSLAAAIRRADALEEFARSNASGGIGDGVDLLLATLSIVAADDDSAEPDTARRRASAGGTVFVDPSHVHTAGGGGGDAPGDATVPGDKTP